MSDKLPDGKLPAGLPPPSGSVTVEEISMDRLASLQAEQAKLRAAAAAAAATADPSAASGKFSFPLNSRYLHYSLSALPEPYASLDTNRLTLCHFCVQSLSLLSDARLFGASGGPVRARLRRWILNLLVTSGEGGLKLQGFTGGTWQGGAFVDRVPEVRPGGGAGPSLSPKPPTPPPPPPPPPPTPKDGEVKPAIHLAMTYCGILTLLTLGDSLSSVDGRAVMRGVASLQNLDRSADGPLYGSFKSHQQGSESDMRFCYCAVAVERALWKTVHPGATYDAADETYIDKRALLGFVRACKTYDGGLGLFPGGESHGGSYFTGLATLSILGAVDDVFTAEERLRAVEWGACRQGAPEGGGMQGRRNKDSDTCYSYWVGGGLAVLGGGAE